MRKRIVALVMGLALLLSGCAAMLGRSYQSVTPHNKIPVTEEETSAVRAEKYAQLVEAIYGFVTLGKEEGVIRLHSYEGDVQSDLGRACDEVSHEDPLGAYAVDGIKYSYKRIVSYYEATISINYRRTPEQISGVENVTGSGAIRSEVEGMLAAFQTEIALRTNYFNEDEALIQDLIRQAYYATPAAAFGLPQAQVNLYPEAGLRRIVEIVLTYPGGDTPEARQSKMSAMMEVANTRSGAYLHPGDSIPQQIEALWEALRSQSRADETAPATPYAALLEGSANSEGMALAFKLLCDIAGLECIVAEGTLEGQPHFWTIVSIGEGHRHVDATWSDGLLLTDADMEARGAAWEREGYPICGDAKNGGESDETP